MSTSLKQIAADLGVSISLVSKVLNDRLGTTGARPELIAAVRQRARALGYRRNLSAVGLRAGRQNVIGVFIHQLGAAGSGIIEAMLDGISVAAARAHQKLFLNFYHSDAQFRELAALAHRGMMDGLLVGGLAHPELTEDFLRLARTELPLVTIHDEELHPLLPNVGMDQVEVGRLATRHLLQRGCRSVAHIRTMDARYRGYRDALMAQGVAPDAALVVHCAGGEQRMGNFGYQAGQTALRELLRRGVRFDGLVAQSDQQAAGALNELTRAGRAVPGDVRIIGVDDAPFCDFASVPLSSISQEFHARGAAAMRLLLEGIGGKPMLSSVIAPRLRARASTR